MMNRHEVMASLKSYLETDFPNDDIELTPNTSLLDEWFVDSLSIVEVVVFMESTFDVLVARADINGDTFASLETLTDFVVARLQTAP